MRRETYYGRQENPNLRTRRGRKRPRRPSESTSFKRQIRLVLLATAAIAAWYLTPISDLVVNVMLEQMPVEADIELQHAALQSFPYPTVYSSTWTPEIQRVGKDLIRTLHRHPNYSDDERYDYDWDFGVVHANFVNAFCLPGGQIRVTDTLLRTLNPTTGELAALLGHEIGHVVSRHAQRRMLTDKALSYLLGAIFYEDHDDNQETFGQALGELITKSAAWLGQQRFSRRDEYQADDVSWDLLMGDGYSKYTPKSLESLLSKLKNLQDDNDAYSESLIAAWSRTHPATSERLVAIDEKWNGLRPSGRRRLSRNNI